MSNRLSLVNRSGSGPASSAAAYGRVGASWVPLAIGLWAVGLGAGLHSLWSYSYTPAASADAPSRWPGGVSLTHDTSRPTLVMFLHPLCSCSEASLHELAVLMSRAPGRVAVTAVIAENPVPESNAAESLRADAAAITGVHVVTDVHGGIAKTFGAQASGQVLVYGADASLAFAGGITSARGHEGDNDGLDAAVAVALGRVPAGRATPVFGCALSDRQAPIAGGAVL